MEVHFSWPCAAIGLVCGVLIHCLIDGYRTRREFDWTILGSIIVLGLVLAWLVLAWLVFQQRPV